MPSPLEADKNAIPPEGLSSDAVCLTDTSTIEHLVPEGEFLGQVTVRVESLIPEGESFDAAELGSIELNEPSFDDCWRKLQAIHLTTLDRSESELADFRDFLQKLFEEILDTLILQPHLCHWRF